jgi:hypothetical protein
MVTTAPVCRNEKLRVPSVSRYWWSVKSPMEVLSVGAVTRASHATGAPWAAQLRFGASAMMRPLSSVPSSSTARFPVTM